MNHAIFFMRVCTLSYSRLYLPATACLNTPMTLSISVQPKEILAAIKGSTKIIWICSPNNPTANDIEEDRVRDVAFRCTSGGDELQIRKILESNFRGLVILDEAYVDFSER